MMLSPGLFQSRRLSRNFDFIFPSTFSEAECEDDNQKRDEKHENKLCKAAIGKMYNSTYKDIQKTMRM